MDGGGGRLPRPLPSPRRPGRSRFPRAAPLLLPAAGAGGGGGAGRAGRSPRRRPSRGGFAIPAKPGPGPDWPRAEAGAAAMPGRRRGAAGAYLSPSGAWLASSWTCPGAAARPPPGASSSRPRGPCPPCLSLPPAPRNFAGLSEAKQRQQRDRLSDFSLLCLLQCGKFNSCPPPRAPRGSPPGDKKKKKNHRRNSCDFFFFLSFFFLLFVGFFSSLRCANSTATSRAPPRPRRLFVLVKVCRRPAALSPARHFENGTKSRAGLPGPGGGRGENERLKIRAARRPRQCEALRGCDLAAVSLNPPRPLSAPPRVPPLAPGLGPRSPLTGPAARLPRVRGAGFGRDGLPAAGRARRRLPPHARTRRTEVSAPSHRCRGR